MSFKAEIFAAFFPGGLLIVLGGTLMKVAHTVGITLGMSGFLLLISWPIFVIVTNIRHGRLVKRSLPGPPPADRAYDFVVATRMIIIMFVLPVALLGGLGIFCLITAAQGAEEPLLRIVGGVGSLLLLVSYLLFFVLGRTTVTLRLIGGAVIILGGVVAVATFMEILHDRASGGDVAGFVVGLVMILGGGWLLVTGSNTFSRPEKKTDGDRRVTRSFSVSTTASMQVNREASRDVDDVGR